MISTSNIEQAKKEIKSSKENPIVVKAQNDEFNRKILEYGRFNILLLSYQKTKDRIKQLDSNLNHVLAKIAAKKNVIIAYDLEELRKLEKKDKGIFLARIKQNIEICRKSKTRIKLLNIKDKKDAFFLMLSIGSSTKQAKEAL